MKNRGTPKTLIQAIEDAGPRPGDIQAAVLDFLAQKFSAVVLESYKTTHSMEFILFDLWARIKVKK